MWNDPIQIKHPESCPLCCNKIYIRTGLSKCKRCGRNKNTLRCRDCEFNVEICLICESDSPSRSHVKENIGTNQGRNSWFPTKMSWCLLTVLGCAVLAAAFFYKPSETFGTVNPEVLKKLMKKYPSQKNETWYNFFSTLENKIPSVKSVIFLHGEDEKTSNCLTKELVFLFSMDKIVNIEDITFSGLKYEVKDYGLVLEHYRPIVKRYRVFITDMNKISGDIARIFHSLCDEVSSDIKPSLFIFTLKYDERTKNLRPLERATAILKKTWHDLPPSEMFPLFSRVIRNVIDVVPEKQVSC